MTDWYYHDPVQGRVGPLSAEQLRNRYADRRIQRDTLAWHAGVREWQPLDRFSEELQLDTVTPDASQPPPLPPPSMPGPPAMATMSSSQAPRMSRAAPTPRRGLSGCAIVAIVGACLVPVIAILAAIAIPAYQDYVIRAKSTAGLVGAASAIQRAVAEHMGVHGRCPGNEDFAPLLRQFAAVEKHASVQLGTLADGNCAFEFTLHGIARSVEGKTWLYEARRNGDALTWDCTGGDLPARYRPAACRSR